MKLTAVQTQLIQQVAKENDFKDFQLDIQQAAQKGDNFVGTTARINIKNESGNLRLFLKSAPNVGTDNKIQSTRNLFLREIYIYETIFPEFVAYEEGQNISNRFGAHPKLFGANNDNNSEMLLLEDMTEKGYQMCNKKLTMNSHHIEAVLREYAKFHSISLAMNSKKPDRFKKITEHLKDMFQPNYADKSNLDKLNQTVFSNLYKSVEGDPVAIEALRKLEKLVTSTGHERNPDPCDLLVVTHGDCWCNNFLFKYEIGHKEKPSDVRIIDWQISKLGSPATDICYFLFANGSPEILNDYKKYLKLYHDVLKEKLLEFSCDPEEMVSFEALETQFIMHSIPTLLLCTVVLRILMFEPDEAPDFTTDFGDLNEIQDILDSQFSNIDEYYRRIGCVVQFLVKNGIFNNLDK